MGSNTKDTNPKDAIGSQKVPEHLVSSLVVMEMALGMLEGACKYGAHNYRVAGVRGTIYYDAAQRHLKAWLEGEDIDPKSGIHHIGKALSCLSVLRDGMFQGNWVDDRPPKSPGGWVDKMNEKAAEIIAQWPNPLPPYTEQGRNKEQS